MGSISRLTTWSSGDTLTASALNAEFNNILSEFNGSISNTNISGAAGITYGKLSLTSGIVNADISSSAAIAYSKLNLASSIIETDLNLSDNTTKDVSTTKHGFVPKAPNNTTTFLRGDATWATPSTISFATSGQQGSFSGTSTSYDNVTGATVTISPTSTVTVHAVITGRWSQSAGSGQDMFVNLLIDGASVQAYSMRAGTASYESSFCVSGQASVSSGSRIIKLQYKVTSGTIVIDQANVSVIYA